MEHSQRHRVSEAIDPELRPGKGLSRFNRIVIWAILALVAVGVLETEIHILQRFGGLMGALKIALFAFFAVEYCLRLWVAALNPRYRNWLHYAVTPSALLDLFVLVTLAVPFLGVETTVFRLMQLARLVRLARIGRYSRAMNLLFEAIRSRGTELVLALIIAFALMLASATLLYIVEGPVQPEAFGSIPRALWWAVATLTTVGYGDVVPVTALGRTLAAVTALAGIGFIALPTGILVGAFSDALRRARDERWHDRLHGRWPD